MAARLVVMWSAGKVQVRRESDVGALAPPMLQLESLAGLFFCRHALSNLGSGNSCLPFERRPAAQVEARATPLQ